MSTRVNGTSVRLIVVGAAGRMGARLCALAHAEEPWLLVAALERAGSARIGEPAAPRSARGEAPQVADFKGFAGDLRADVVIDFSSDEGAGAAIAGSRTAHSALLVGTTALSAPTIAALREESARRAVLVSPNMSPGVALVAALVRQAGAALAGYDCSIVESHHSAKKDAPSGTALRLADAARQGGSRLADANIVSIRGGDVVGEHTVRFAGPGEYVELTHRATSRDVFVRGALRAAAWLKGRAPGWYTMEDVLDLSGR